MTEIRILRVLRESTFFGLLDERVLKLLSKIAIRKSFKKDEVIFKEGDQARSLFFIVEGWVKIFKISEEGKEHIVHIFGNGEVFAEISLMENQVYPAWAVALTHTDVIIFERTRILKLLKENPELSLAILGLCIKRLRELLFSIEIKTKDVRKRLMLFLWEKSDKGKNEVVDLEFTKKDLSILLGMTPETFSRILKKLKQEGVIIKSLNNRKIQINPQVLATKIKHIRF